jgi:endonuclease-3
MNPQKAKQILDALKKNYPNAGIILKYSNNFELLVSVMLSAQTTDLQVNKVTQSLFPKHRGKTEKDEIENFANAEHKELENDIKSIGLYKNKTKNIQAASKVILQKYNGKIPKTMVDLTSLPGVGRKTANVVLGNAYKIFEGVAVDTHVKRLSLLYGFSKEKNPEKIEKDLMRLFDKKDWFSVTYLLIEHGRNTRKIKKDFIFEQGLL